MSREGAQAVFGAAITDQAFCRTLLACPAKAIEGFELTAEEFDVLANIQASSLQQLAAKFERWRLSKAGGSERYLSQHPRDAYAGERLAG